MSLSVVFVQYPLAVRLLVASYDLTIGSLFVSYGGARGGLMLVAEGELDK